MRAQYRTVNVLSTCSNYFLVALINIVSFQCFTTTLGACALVCWWILRMLIPLLYRFSGCRTRDFTHLSLLGDFRGQYSQVSPWSLTLDLAYETYSNARLRRTIIRSPDDQLYYDIGSCYELFFCAAQFALMNWMGNSAVAAKYTWKEQNVTRDTLGKMMRKKSRVAIIHSSVEKFQHEGKMQWSSILWIKYYRKAIISPSS